MASSNGYPETADIETSSEGYARRFAGDTGTWFLQIQEDATLRMLFPYSNATVLDVGGGHGQLTRAIIQHGYQLTVLGSAEICKSRIQSFIDRNLCSFEVGNILELPYPDRSFDAVLSFRLLPHVSQWKKFISELARVSDKSVILDYPELRSINFLTPYLFQFKKSLEGNTRPYKSFREIELLDAFKTQGFVLASKFPEFFLPMVFHRKLNDPRISSVLERLFREAGLTGRLGSPVILKLVRSEG